MGPVERGLRKSLAFFEGGPERWTKGRSSVEDDTGRTIAVCCIGAIVRSTITGAESHGAISVFSEVTGRGGIANWNDAPDTSYDDVIAAFRRAVDVAKERGV